MSGQAAAETKLPRNLSHFTTLAGLHGIVTSRQLWASNVSFLNDRREIKHGLEASLAAIEEIVGGSRYKQWNAALRAVARRLESGEIPNTYAVCMCAKADVLSQWRGYGGGVQGVSLTFDQTKLGAIFQQEKATLLKVVYANFTTRTKVRRSLRAALDEAELTKEIETVANSNQSPEQRARDIVNRLLPQFKHLGFSEEKEFRYVIQHRTIRDEVAFRPDRNVMVPYIKIPRTPADNLPITKITIGPGRDQGLTKESVELFLQKQELYDTEVVLSDVPYRA